MFANLQKTYKNAIKKISSNKRKTIRKIKLYRSNKEKCN